MRDAVTMGSSGRDGEVVVRGERERNRGDDDAALSVFTQLVDNG